MEMAASPPPQPQLTAADTPAGIAQQEEEGWPLGLSSRPLSPEFFRNRRVRIFTSSISQSSTLLTANSSIRSSSTDVDSESTESSYSPGDSITLGSLMGVSDTAALSQRPPRVTTVTETSRHKKHHCKSRRKWCSVLCSKLTTDAINIPDAPSLGHFLQAERKFGSVYKRRHNPLFYSPHIVSHEAAHISEA